MEVFRSGIPVLITISMYKASRKFKADQLCNVLGKGAVKVACLGLGFVESKC